MRVDLNLRLAGPWGRMGHSSRVLAVRGSGLVLSGTLFSGGNPLDLSAAGTSVQVAVRGVGAGSDELTGLVACEFLPGLEAVNGFVDVSPPYDIPGRGGRLRALVQASAIPVAGDYEAELAYTPAGATDVLVLQDLVRIYARDAVFEWPAGDEDAAGDAAATGGLYLGETRILIDASQLVLS